MPLYEYRCDSCRETFERLEEAGKDSSGERCPSCSWGRLAKIFSVLGNVRANEDSCSPGGSTFQ